MVGDAKGYRFEPVRPLTRRQACAFQLWLLLDWETFVPRGALFACEGSSSGSVMSDGNFTEEVCTLSYRDTGIGI